MYVGPWIKMLKTPESSERQAGRPVVTLMHDDSVTKELGFAGGFVGGPNLEGVMGAAITASFGQLWFEGGVHSARIFKPIFADEEVRVVWEEVEPEAGDRRKIRYALERKDGERTAAGWAAMGPAGSLKAPWERVTGGPAEATADVLPSVRVGDKLNPLDRVISGDEMTSTLLDRIQDSNWWYRIASPWGRPVVPPFMFGSLVLRYTVEAGMERAAADEVQPLWVYAGVDAMVYKPVFVGGTYRFEGKVVEKGVAGRSISVTRECDISEVGGPTVARVRLKARLLQAAASSPRSDHP